MKQTGSIDVGQYGVKILSVTSTSVCFFNVFILSFLLRGGCPGALIILHHDKRGFY